jgi:hypothetical protein
MTTATFTTDTFEEHGHPAWRVCGTLGIVTYSSRNNRITVEPIGGEASLLTSQHADEVKLAAATGTDEDVLLLLAGWYAKLPGLGQPATLDPADPWAFPRDPTEGELLYAWQESIESGRPVSAAERHAFDQAQHQFDRRAEAADRGPETGNPEVDRWRALRGDDLTAAMMAATWYAQVDDLIGGWCITVVDLPSSAGGPEVASVMDEAAARHIADLHNAHVRNEARRADDRTRIAAILAARPNVQPGDLVDTPAGADSLYATRRRMIAETVSNYGIGGYKLKANGQPHVSHSTDPSLKTRGGYISAYIDWGIAAKSTITRGEETIHTPEGTQ